MSLDEQIEGLLRQAEPLRALSDEAAEAAGLPKLIERINALRVGERFVPEDERVARFMASMLTEPKRGPGRPRKPA